MRKKRISPLDPITVEVRTPNIKISYDLLCKENLDRIGISRSDIREVQPIFAIPGYLYEEEGLASKHHRLLGSACAELRTYDNRRCSFDDLWYFDENINKDHFEGKQHWNHERRIVDHSNGKIVYFNKYAKPHIIQASPYMDISLDPGPKGRKAKKRVFRP